MEKSRFENIRYGETLAPKIRHLLMDLGIWKRFLDDNHLKSNGIQSAWGREELFENDFLLNPYGNGWNLDRVRFDAMLLDEAQKKGALVFRGAAWEECSQSGAGEWNIAIQCDGAQHRFQSRFLIDATGRSSSIAKSMGARRIHCDQLIGVAAFFPTPGGTTSHTGYTLIESEENGWWYSAELPQSETVAVFMTDGDLYAGSKKRSPGFWRERLASSVFTKNRFELPKMTANPRAVAANTSIIHPVAGADWLAVGDAALSLDPLSSQGIYKSMESGINAAKSVDGKFRGTGGALRGYSDSIAAAFKSYLNVRRSHYKKVNRWPESAFWRRRS